MVPGVELNNTKRKSPACRPDTVKH